MANNNGEKQQQVVCVTGAGGFIGSWVVKELLFRGYRVRGTARDPTDRKNAHLLALDGAKERLTLHRANVLDYDELRAIFTGCHGVFHVASPVSNDSELVPVAVEGTRNVITAAADTGVRRVVFTSSYGAVHMNPSRSPDAVIDETCWSDYEFCKRTGNLYCCAKMMAENTATEEAAKRGLELAVILPSVTMGPTLQQALNYSTYHVSRYMTGARTTYPNTVAAYTDVRDVARAHVLVYERPDAHGRYLCIGVVLHRAQLFQMLGELFPQYPITAKYGNKSYAIRGGCDPVGDPPGRLTPGAATVQLQCQSHMSSARMGLPLGLTHPGRIGFSFAKCVDDGKPMVKPYKFSNQRLRNLGLEFTPIRKSLYESVISMIHRGHLSVIVPQHRACL